jgi:hypothetical protein
MRRFSVWILAISLLSLWGSAAHADEPEIAEILFGSSQSTNMPRWVKSVDQVGGIFTNDAWVVGVEAPKEVGEISISIDREHFNEDVALVVLCADWSKSELVVRLLDHQGQPVVTNLFGNVLDVTDWLGRDVHIIPLRRYPSATRIVLQRISGPILIDGVFLFPLVSQPPREFEAADVLARMLGEPPGSDNGSPDDNPQSKRLLAPTFVASSMNAGCFGVVGFYYGRYRVHPDSVEVWVYEAVLYGRMNLLKYGPAHEDAISVALAGFTGKDCQWNHYVSSISIPLDVTLKSGDRYILRNLHFVVPKDRAPDLAYCWLLFQLENRTHKNERGQTVTGWTYAHTSEDIFSSTRRTRD